MRIVTSITAMQRLARGHHSTGGQIGFVPTMGCLHAGHLSLTKRARQAVGPRGLVVVSIYVNPTQFGPQEDFQSYPRDLARDARLCREAGVDVVFAPRNEAMYPAATGQSTARLSSRKASPRPWKAERDRRTSGASPPVVTKLFHVVAPDVAVFGQKDYQQAAVIQRMTRDLNFPVKIVVAPTVREADGLAMSSRNQYPVGRRTASGPSSLASDATGAPEGAKRANSRRFAGR